MRTTAAFALLALLASPAFAPIDTSVIVGRVADDSGAVLPGVTVVAGSGGNGPGRIARANCVGDAAPSGFNQTLDSWMDPEAFAPTTTRTYRNCANNTVGDQSVDRLSP